MTDVTLGDSKTYAEPNHCFFSINATVVVNDERGAFIELYKNAVDSTVLTNVTRS